MNDPRALEIEAFAAYRAHPDLATRNRLVESHRRLAVALARRFEHRGEPLDDLVQVAQIGLLKSVERFDPDRGVAFTTFAMPTVLGELKRHFRDKTWSVRVPRGLKDLHLKVAPAVAELHQSLRRSPTVAEIASHLGCSEDDLLEAMEAGAAYQASSLDAGSQGGDGPSLSDRVGIGDDHDRTETRVTVRWLMARLPERERSIVYLRYFEDLTQAEIAERVGVSQVHVSRLLRRALARLGSDA